LDSYDVGVVLVETGSGLARVLESENGWLQEFRDEMVVVYSRK
jgi:hypothetical protein